MKADRSQQNLGVRPTKSFLFMQKLIAGLLLILVACHAKEQAVTNQTDSSATTLSDTLRRAVLRGTQVTANRPGTESETIIDTVPSSPLTRFDDSVIATAAGQQIVITPRGDTIQWLGGTMFNVDSIKEYGADYYAKNGSRYLRVTLLAGHQPNGKAIEVTKARVLLPANTSDEDLVLAGLCRVDTVRDPRILAIATVPEGETYGPARYAWRFDPVTESLSGIPTSNVTCAQVQGED